MTSENIPTYTPAEALRMIEAKTARGEYRVDGWLDLTGCDLSGVALPATVGGWLHLSGCKNPDPTQWWSDKTGTRWRCIAVSYYALCQTEDGRLFAGCAEGLTREEALDRWDRADERDVLFTAAIKEHAL